MAMKKYFEYFNRFYQRKYMKSEISEEDIIFELLPDISCSDGSRHSVENDSALLVYLYETWKNKKRNNILLVGEGGAGKTIGMHYLCQKLISRMVNVLYIPLFEFEVLEFTKIDDYIKEYVISNSTVYNEFMEEIATSSVNGIPDLILLLDGYNEITSKKSEVVVNLRKWQIYERVQIVMSSREESLKRMEVVKLKNLEKKAIKQYIDKYVPNVEPKMYHLLKNPMMLSLYVNTQKHYEKCSEKDYVELRKEANAGTILWNYVHLEMLKYDYLEDFSDNDFSYKKASLLLIIMYILPYLGWRMAHKNHVTYSELDLMMNELQNNFENKNPAIKKQVEKICFLNERYWWDSVFLKKIIFEQLYLMKIVKLSEDQKVICFCHQNFRDFFACYYYYMDLFCAKKNTRPLSLKVWERQEISYDTMKYLCDLVEVDQWEKLITVVAENSIKKTGGYSVINMFKILGYIYNEDFRQKNFEGLNLEKICLKQYQLSDGASYASFKKCVLGEDTFWGEGHRGRVVEVAYSMDGKYIASICTSGELKIWDCINYTKIDELCMKDSLYALTWVDNSRVLTGTLGGECIEYNIKKKEKKIIDFPAKEAIRTLACVKNTIIIGGFGGSLCTINQNEICMSKLHESPVIKIKCSDKFIFSLEQDGEIVVSRQDNLQTEIVVKNKRFTSIDLSADRLITCTLEGEIYFCDLSVIEHTENLNCVWNEVFQEWKINETYKFNCIRIINQTMVVCGTRNSEIVVCDMEEKTCSLFPAGHRGWIRSLDVLTKSDEFVSGGSDGKVIFWDINSVNKKCEKNGTANMVLGHDYFMGGKGIITTGNDCKVNIWDLQKWKKKEELIDHDDWVRTVSVANKHNVFVSGGSDGRIYLWRITDLERMVTEKKLLFQGKHWILSLEWSTDDLYFFSSDYSGAILGWRYDYDIHEYRFRQLYSHNCPVYCVKNSPDGKILASCDCNGTIILWDIFEAKKIDEIHVRKTPIRQVRWNPNGEQFAVCLPEYGVIIYSYDKYKKETLKLREILVSGVRALAYMENKLLYAGENKGLYSINLEDYEITIIDQLHHDYIDFINISGNYISTSGHDGLLIIRNRQSKNYQVLQALPDVNILNCEFEDCIFENEDLRELIESNGGRIS